MKLALALAVALALALVIAVRIPASADVLEDVPGLGWLVDLIGANHELRRPVELRFRADHPDQLAYVHLPNAHVRGDTLVISASDELDAQGQRDRLAAQLAPLPAYIVIYQSDELTALQRALRTDEQARKLGLSVELDHIGYHLAVSSAGMYVNPAWAEQHHCDARDRLVGTGVYCTVTAAQRLEAYMRGDPGLFTDPHPVELPPGRTFLPDDDYRAERFYEVDLPAIPLALTSATPRGDSLDITVAGGLPSPTSASDVELVIQIAGKLYVVTHDGDRLTIATGPELADELATSYALAAAGLHELR